jgi:hypothetical protein
MSVKTKIGVAIALATVLASPAFAAKRHHHSHHRSWSIYAAGQHIGLRRAGVRSNRCPRIGAWILGYPGQSRCP